MEERKEETVERRASALLPIGVFLVLYLGLGIVFEYILKIEEGFYKTPTIVVFLIALFVACIQNRKLDFNAKLKVMAKGVADENILTMCLVFLTAGAFSGAISAAGGADSTVNLFLTFLPVKVAVAGLFLIACFVSLSMGTSVGTISALSSFALSMSQTTGYDVVLCIAAVVCGAMFGDNLSMISDTTIAAVRTQGCEMKDKFRENFLIVLPAAIITIVLFFLVTMHGDYQMTEELPYSIWRVVPYLLVLVGALIGINVFVVLLGGTAVSLIVGLATGSLTPATMFSAVGDGVTGMYDITVISIVVACIVSLVREAGGIQFILDLIRRRIRSSRGAEAGIAGLAILVDLCTANNTVAIVMSGPIAKEISMEFGVSSRRSASLLDIFTSVGQGLIPYGAQLLSAASLTGITPFDILPYLYYPLLMALSAALFIAFRGDRSRQQA